MVPSSTADDADDDVLTNSIVERLEKGSLALSPNLLGVERIVRKDKRRDETDQLQSLSPVSVVGIQSSIKARGKRLHRILIIRKLFRCFHDNRSRFMSRREVSEGGS
jgi:hypothetical protein